MSNQTEYDFTPKGLKIEGAYENDRNIQSSDLFKAIIREACGAKDVIIAHHLTYVVEEEWDDGFKYQIIEEIPSADALIFDHDIARKIWGLDWRDVLARLALTPISERDAELAHLYYRRKNKPA
jgi:hypothetical protein